MAAPHDQRQPRRRLPGRLRLLQYSNTALPTGRGLVITFDYGAWGGTGADGTSFFLFDGATPTFNVGANGGSLGYAQKSGVNGLSGGYLGLGLDEFGNYSNPNEGRVGPTGGSAIPEAVAIRGPGSGTTGYAYLAGTTNLTKTPWSLPKLDCPKNYGSCGSDGVTRPADTYYYRQVQITVTPVGSAYQVTVAMNFSKNTPDWKTLFGPFTMPTSAPGTLKMGFAGSTGGNTNYHEIRNLTVTQQVPDLTATKAVLNVNGGNLKPGDELLYTVVLHNQTTSAITGVHFSDPIPTKTTYKSGSVTYPSGTLNSTSPTLDITGITVPASGQATITFRVTLDSSGFNSGDIISNQGTVKWNLDALSGLTDGDTATAGEQATAIVVTTSGPNFDTMSKTVSWQDVAPTNGYVSPGDILTYQVVIPNTGDQNAGGNQFLDVLPTNTTYKNGTATVVSGGGTISYNSSLNRIEWTGTINQNASVTLTFQVTVNSGVQIRDLISNQGTLNYSSSGSGPLNATTLTDADNTQPGKQPTQLLVGGVATLTATKTAAVVGGGSLQPGSQVLYTILLSNTGSYAVSGATFADTLPANTTYVSSDTDTGTASFTSPALSVTGLNLGSGARATIHLTVQVASSLPGGVTQISN